MKLGGDGAKAWERRLAGATVTAVRTTGSGAVVHGSFKGTLDVAGTKLTPPSGADHGYFLALLAGDGTPRWARRIEAVQETSDAGVKTLLAVDRDGRIAVVTGADACTAAVNHFEADGTPRWRRSLAVNGCGGRGFVAHGIATTPSGLVAVGGALSTNADFGTGTLEALATDALVVGLEP